MAIDNHPYRKPLRMVSELHVRGYQRIRIAPGLAPSGLFWRCDVTPVSSILRSNGALMRCGEVAAHYTTGDERLYFGWTDARHATRYQMADLFVERFPAIAAAGYGSDWTYAGWYQEMMRLTGPDSLPIAYTDTGNYDHCLGTWGPNAYRELLLPPPGEALLQKEIVRNWGGYLVRMLATLNAFRAMHGSWPTGLCLTEGVLEALQSHLTEEGMELLQERLRLVVEDGPALMVTDFAGHVVDYERDGVWEIRQDQHADQWLGFGRLSG